MYANLSFFAQTIYRLNRKLIVDVFKRHGSDKGNKGGINSWSHFVTMLFGQLSGADSLREVCFGMAACEKETRNLQINALPNKSSLSYLNKNRSWLPFRDVFFAMKKDFESTPGIKKRSLRIKSKVFLLDSTVIPLCLSVYDWAKYTTTKGAVKIHMMLDAVTSLPGYVYVSNGKTPDVRVAWTVPLSKGSVVVMDRGYTDYALYDQWTNQGVFFVTRLKCDAVYKMIDVRQANWKYNILSDADIQLGGRIYRRIIIFIPEKNDTMELLTNQMTWTASTIADLYKSRWEIESFFKDLKQNLKIKTFYGTNENAVMIQIWTALIAYLIIRYLKAKAAFGWGLSNLIAFIRMTLFSRIDLQFWLDNPLELPPEKPPPGIQYTIFN